MLYYLFEVKEIRFGGHNMKKLLFMMGILMISLTLVGCDRSGEESVPPSFGSITIDNTNPFDGTDLKTYYKGKNDEIAVKIELVNPSNFTINSIKIDGYNYRFYLFTDQSNNSTIYFNMNAKSTLMEKIYSVDEIIYQVGANSKIVYVENNNEFKIHIYKDLPEIEREDYSASRDSISIDFDVVDTDNVIAEGTLIVELFSGETLVEDQELEVGQDTIEFTSLLANHHYEVKVRADYDLDDSFGESTEVLIYSGTFATVANSLPSSIVSNFVVSENSITFDLTYNDEDDVTSLAGLRVAIFDGNTLYRETEITGTLSGIRFDDLLNDHEYTLKVLSNYDLGDGHSILTDNVLSLNGFTTLPRIIPEPQILNLELEENRVLFDVEISDPLGLIFEDTLVAKLYIDDELVEEAKMFVNPVSEGHSETLIDFELYNLVSNREFLIEIEASYNLNDGIGIQTDKVIFSRNFTTLINAIPSVNVKDVIVTQGYVTIDLEVFDINDTLKSLLTATLYENDIVVDSVVFGLDDAELVLDYLVMNTKGYSLEITADYDLRDGFPVVNDYILSRWLTFSDIPKAPAAELLNIVETNDSISLDVRFMDIDETVASGSLFVYLYLNGEEKEVKSLSIGTTSIEFDGITHEGLLSNNEYEIIVTADYNLDKDDDIAFLQVNQVLISGNILTLEKEIPIAFITNETEGTEYIAFDINVLDPDLVIEDNSLKAILYRDGVPVPTSEVLPLDIGENFSVTFGVLLSDKDYKVVVEVKYDLNDGLGLVVEDEFVETRLIKTNKKFRPILRDDLIIFADKESIWFDVNILDDDDVIVGDPLALLFQEGINLPVKTLVLNEGLNSTVTFDIDILSDQRYTVKIVTDYYLNDETPTVLGAEEGNELDYDLVTTIEKEMLTAEFIEGSITYGKTDIIFSVLITDEDTVITRNLQAVLYENDLPVDTVSPVSLDEGLNELESFTGLDADTVYEIKIETYYDLNDIDGELFVENLATYEDRTEVLFNPTAVITINNTFETVIEYEVFVTDDDDAISLGTLYAVLYKDGLVVLPKQTLSVGNNTLLAFDELEFGEEYVIKVEAEYSLDSGGSVDDEISAAETVTTHQIIIITSIVQERRQITFTVDTDDVNGIVEPNTGLELQLFDLDGLPVGDTVTINLTSGVFLVKLYSDNDYSVEISATYDLSDGNGVVTEKVYTHEFHSLPLDMPTITINRDPYHVEDNDGGFVVTATSIAFEVDYGADYDEVIVGTLVAYIYANGVADDTSDAIASFTLTDGIQKHTFSGLDTVNNNYQILIQANADWNVTGLIDDDYVFEEVTFIEAN